MTKSNVWLDVAKKDFADAARSKMLWALSALMILFVGIAVYAAHAINEDPAIQDALFFMSTPMLLLIPILGLIVGYMSIVGERESGSIRALLALPIVRWEVIVGKFVGRVGVLWIPIVAGFAIGSAIATVLYGTTPGRAYAEMMVFALTVGIVYVAIAVSISASTNSRGKAMALAVGAFALFEYLWSVIPMGVYYVINRELPAFTSVSDFPNWFLVLTRLAPSNAIATFLASIFEFEGAFGGTGVSNDQLAEVPFFLQEWFSGIVVLLWIAVPLAIGYLRFQRATIS
ncbi:ABC transporter permease subunit [Natronoarchaeum mannanilyticum]|uniref:ABC transporter permease n=1 Tax=Natronoarchaeum mannanilyticum TaxID=926360 RepID=A0AAV3TDV0_9EURY